MTLAALPTGLRLRGAEPADLDAIHTLLRAVGLGVDDVSTVQDRFIVAVNAEARLLGCVALDGVGTELLLRSLAVAPDARGAGMGALLVEAALLEARARKVATVVLVTETAADWFERHGFRRIERDTVEDALRDHPQFAGACPASATVMRIELDREGA